MANAIPFFMESQTLSDRAHAAVDRGVRPHFFEALSSLEELYTSRKNIF